MPLPKAGRALVAGGRPPPEIFCMRQLVGHLCLWRKDDVLTFCMVWLGISGHYRTFSGRHGELLGAGIQKADLFYAPSVEELQDGQAGTGSCQGRLLQHPACLGMGWTEPQAGPPGRTQACCRLSPLPLPSSMLSLSLIFKEGRAYLKPQAGQVNLRQAVGRGQAALQAGISGKGRKRTYNMAWRHGHELIYSLLSVKSKLTGGLGRLRIVFSNRQVAWLLPVQRWWLWRGTFLGRVVGWQPLCLGHGLRQGQADRQRGPGLPFPFPTATQGQAARQRHPRREEPLPTPHVLTFLGASQAACIASSSILWAFHQTAAPWAGGGWRADTCIKTDDTCLGQQQPCLPLFPNKLSEQAGLPTSLRQWNLPRLELWQPASVLEIRLSGG